ASSCSWAVLFGRSVTRHGRGSAARVAADDCYATGRAVDCHGALMRLRREDYRSARRWRAVAIEREGRNSGKVGRRAIQREWLFCEIDTISGAGPVETCDPGERVRRGGIRKRNRLSGAREPSLCLSQLEICLYAPGGRLDPMEQ